MAKSRSGSPLIEALRRQYAQFAKNLRHFPRTSEAGGARTYCPVRFKDGVTDQDKRIALDAAMDLRADILERGWELPSEEFEVSFEYISTGAAVTLIAGDGEGAELTRGFLVASIDPESFDAAVFLRAFLEAGLIPRVHSAEVVPLHPRKH